MKSGRVVEGTSADVSELQERERQIAILRTPGPKPEQQVRVPPKTLAEALSRPGMISLQEIRSLAEATYQSPVVSFYSDVTPQMLIPAQSGLVRAFRSKKKSALEGYKTFIEALPRQQQKIVDNDLRDIESFLTDYPVANGIRSLIIFKSGTALNEVLALPVLCSNHLIVDPDPFVLPLENILEEHRRVLALQVSKEESAFFVYQLGSFRKIDRIKSFVPTDSVDASRPGHVQRHRLNHLHWHLKLTANTASRLYAQWFCQNLVLVGEERVSHSLEEFLHDNLLKQVIGRIYGSPAADDRNLKEVIENALRNHKQQLEVQAVQELGEYRPDVVACGLRQVIEVCNLFLARRLFISDRIERSGFVCRQHHYVSLEAAACPFCGAPLVPVSSVIDELVEIARIHGIGLTMIEYRQEMMSKYDGIAGVTYVPIGHH
jgi:hypothetical protein